VPVALDDVVAGTKNNAARFEAGGVGAVGGVRSEGRIEQVRAGVGVQEVVAVEVLLEALDLIAVAGLEEVQDVMDEVVDLHDRIVAESGHRDGSGDEVIGGEPLGL
jgi:hypothetical protein